MSAIKETYNVLPRLTFRWVKANELLLDTMDVDLTKEYFYGKLEGDSFKLRDREDLPLSQDFRGVNERMVALVEESPNAGLYIHVKKGEEKSLFIAHRLGRENNVLLEKNVIVLEAGAKMTLVMDYSSDDTETFSNTLNKIQVAEDAELNIIKVQRLNSRSRHLESRYSTVESRGKVNYISVEIGGEAAVVNYMTDLAGDEAEGHVKNVYLGFGERILDLSHHMNHMGKKTKSDMIFKGALKDKSKKAFRGTLDFKHGSTHSEGNEEEFTILLSPKVKSYAIPLLLCREDDVIGNHAASNGQIDEEKLFYIMSRGLSEEEAKKIIIESHIRPIIDLIPLDSIREIILDAVERELKGE
ncbi:Fe-S cluster assembly protein SufD [Proteiniclasticum sp. BAD-10]|uniref:Fe-S cluster assembly protein SufD n=1 Tax=Proteiniclasticum sediminis TaxID=2804028 RepID=A0A941HQU7_9CLOT|nr:Fe-S cluster assembly protein SufD [Proteiniclasticum sediminis]MBR0575517.1 Fe-S cluster assembly protein SufD [Proteiniclasticum sediminis]